MAKTKNGTAKNGNGANLGFEATLWAAADSSGKLGGVKNERDDWAGAD